MPSQDSEQAKGRGGGAHSTARTSWPSTIEYGIHSSIIGDIGEVITGVSADSLYFSVTRRSTAREGVCVWPSRANDFFLLVLPRLHRLVDCGAGTDATRGSQRDRRSRRSGSVRRCPHGGTAAGRAGARSAGRRDQGCRVVLSGRAVPAGDQG